MNNELFEKLSVNKKYRDVCPDTIRRVIAECEGRYRKPKDMEKAVREKLHGITSAFMNEQEYAKAMALAEKFCPENWEELLACHASTRERLPIAAMGALYGRIFDVTGVPNTLLDLACGINPVYFIGKYPDMQVTGADISGRSVSIISRCGGRALHSDLLCADSVPTERFDVALLFKILPLLERQRSGSATDVLSKVNAEYIVCSFPTRTLGGRNVGMEENYSAWMESRIPKKRDVCARFITANELYYILKEF